MAAIEAVTADATLHTGDLGGTATTAQVTAAGLERTALILVGPALGATEFRESALYAADYDRRFRPGVSQP